MESKIMAGTIEVMVLEVVNPEPAYGYWITQEVLKRSDGAVQLKEGSLYPALHKMERNGLLKAYWEESEAGRRRKFYRITAKGQKALETKRREWQRHMVGVNAVLGIQADVLA